MINSLKIAHLTSAHSRNDTRVFLKQCRSIATAGHNIFLVVADQHKDEVIDGVQIRSVGAPSSRWSRLWVSTDLVFQRACELDCDIYHLHDPELLRVGLKLKRLGKKVVFDSHEDVPKQILSKHYIPVFLRRLISTMVARYERFACSRFDAVVAATPTIREKFSKINSRTIDVCNFPLLNELVSISPQAHSKRDSVVYVGGISEERGIVEVVAAMEHLQCGARLLLGGRFSRLETKRDVSRMAGWQRVDELGFLDRDGVRNALSQSFAGLVALHATPNHLESLPIKMFEYMSAGIPVVASSFPLWRQIIEGNDCGLCVDPTSPDAIAKALDSLAADPDRAEQMGKNGRTAVLEQYNWSVEEAKLLTLYAAL